MTAACVPAYAKTACKATVTSAPFQLSQAGATRSWETIVRGAYGADWADVKRARNKSYSQQPGPAMTFYYLSARPCRITAAVVHSGN
ncbi:MAG: hypothetical protein WDM84_10235 [Bauldia sp.]